MSALYTRIDNVQIFKTHTELHKTYTSTSELMIAAPLCQRHLSTAVTRARCSKYLYVTQGDLR